MDIRIESDGENGRAEVAGDLTIYTAAEAKAALTAALERHAELEVRLDEVGEIDTAGVQILLLLAREAEHLARAVRFSSHSLAVQDLLDLYGLAGLLGAPAPSPSAPLAR